MTTNQLATDIGFTRCAVCKIDLKGRFVYLDEKIESLLGYTKEELFGKSFLEFLDQPSQQLIEALLSQRNHYETFYDTTRINLKNRSGECLTMRVVVSLNFIAGNPVNYQLIIDRDGSSHDSGPTTGSADYKSFVSELSKVASLADWKELLMLLCRFAGARQACVYLVTEGFLEPRSAVSIDSTGEFVFNNIPDAGTLHQLVAETGDEYSFIDQDAVQLVIEKCGSAPNEFVTRIQTTGGDNYIVRLLYADEFSHDQAQTCISDARLVLGLFAKFFDTRSVDSGQTYNIKFTVGFLDALSIPAFLTGADGSILGYNPSTLNLFTEMVLEGNYLEALNHFAELTASGVIDSVVDYLNTPEDGTVPADDFSAVMQVSPAERMRLTVMKLSDDPGDLSSCFVFVPEASEADAVEASASNENPVIWADVLKQVCQDIKATEALARQFGHEFYNELGDTGNKDLDRLTTEMRKLRATTREMFRFSLLMGSDDPPKLTDLNLLVAEQMRKLVPGDSKDNIKCKYQGLPKIMALEPQLAFVLRAVLSNSIKYCDKSTTEIEVTADLREGRCYVTVSDNGFGIGAKHLPRVFEPLYRAADKKVKAVTGLGLGLTLAREMMIAMGGDIEITSIVGEGSRVKINLPVG